MALPIKIFNKRILYRDPITDGDADIWLEFMHTTTGSYMLRGVRGACSPEKNQIEGFKWCILARSPYYFGLTIIQLIISWQMHFHRKRYFSLRIKTFTHCLPSKDVYRTVCSRWHHLSYFTSVSYLTMTSSSNHRLLGNSICCIHTH